MIRLINVSLQRGTQLLFENADLTIHPGGKAGVIGANGSGKSSLFKLFLSQLHVDAGELIMPGQWRVAHMAQEVSASQRSAVDYVLDGNKELRQLQAAIAQQEAAESHDQLGELYAKLDALDGFNAHYRAEQLLHGLGFNQHQLANSVASFSGGWRIRLNLAQALMCPSDLLLLDEPTNHLDLDASVWLEQWLRNYEGTLLIISHDRDFLDNVVSSITHIEHKKCWSYKGNYSVFEKLRAERLAQQQATFEKQQRRKAEIHQFVARFSAKASKARQAQSRIKELQRMEDIAPAHVDSPFDFHFFDSKPSYSALTSLHDADLGYAGQPVIDKANIELLPGSRIGLLGPNGAGKSTLIKSLVGNLPLLCGERKQSDNLMLGYFAQHQVEELFVDETPLEHLRRLRPGETPARLRSRLAGFGLGPAQAETHVGKLSGGQKSRLSLLIATIEAPQMLILDEPTNHLDIESREALGEALTAYSGAVILVSHDMHLLSLVADRLWLVSDGTVKPYEGDLESYRSLLLARDKPASKAGGKAGKARPKRPSRDAMQDLRTEVRKGEARVQKLNGMRDKLSVKLADPELYEDTRKGEAEVWQRKYTEVMVGLDRAESLWMNALEKLEAAEAL